MITAAQFDELNVPILNLYDEFHRTIIKDIARRLKKTEGIMTDAAVWQVQRLVDSGMVYDTAIAEIAKLTNMTEPELKRLFERAGVITLGFDDAVYRAAGLNPMPLNLSPAMLNVLRAGLEKTGGLINNLTKTTAITSQQLYIHAADLAYMQVSSGAMSWNQAIKTAIKEVVKKGVTTVEYPSGHVDQIDVAVRRAVLTGVGQTAAQIQIERANEMQQDLIQVSAHFGARNRGDLPENHEMWQGKVYSRNGNPKYPDFVTDTGYGTGAGLGGWNCRHSFFPFFEGLSVNPYTQEDLDQMAKKTVRYQGKELSQYEASQIQRKYERTIRKYKREAEILAEVGMDNQAELAKVKEYQAKLRRFTKETGLQRQPWREGGKVESVIKRPPPPKIERIPDPPTPPPAPREPKIWNPKDWEEAPRREPIKQPELIIPAKPEPIPDLDAALGGTQEPLTIQQIKDKAETSAPLTQEEIARLDEYFRNLPPEPEQITTKQELLHMSGGATIDELLLNGFKRDENPDRKKGAFESHRVKLVNGDYAIQKPDDRRGFGNMSKREALAYQVDQRLGLDLVPETTFRESDYASYQKYIPDSRTGYQLKRIAMEPGGTTQVVISDVHEVSKITLLDIVTRNADRNSGNWMVTSEGKLIAIDHGLTFGLSYRGIEGLIREIVHDNKNTILMHAVNGLDYQFKGLPIDPKYRDILRTLIGDKNSFLETIGAGALSDIQREDLVKTTEYLIEHWYDYFMDYPGTGIGAK